MFRIVRFGLEKKETKSVSRRCYEMLLHFTEIKVNLNYPILC